MDELSNCVCSFQDGIATLLHTIFTPNVGKKQDSIFNPTGIKKKKVKIEVGTLRGKMFTTQLMQVSKELKLAKRDNCFSILKSQGRSWQKWCAKIRYIQFVAAVSFKN
jgi:hypothetical protein